MIDLHPIDLITNLETLNVSNNLLGDLQSTTNIILAIKNLKSLDLRRNPLTSTLRFANPTSKNWHK